MPKCRRAIGVLLILVGLMAAPVCVAGTDGKDASGGAKATTAAAKAAEKPKEKAASNEDMLAAIEQLKGMIADQSRELEAQRTALRAQQEKMEAMERKVEKSETPTASAPASAVPAAAPPQNGEVKKIDDRLTQVETDFGAYKKANDGKVGRFGPFSFSGDARMRFEPFYGGGPVATQNPNRVRYRVRLRFNATAKFNDEFSGGFSLGSGDTNDPISTNQTLTNGFTRKPFFIDRAFIKYDPKWLHPFSMTVGKFGYTWYRTELTWDNDLNPEGFSESLTWKINNPVLERISLVAFQLPVIEVSTKPDTFIYGGQLQTNWKLGDYVKFGGYVGFTNYQNADALRDARAAATIGGSSNSNAASSNGSQYESKFGLLDVIGRLDFKTPWSRWPVMAQLDFVNNTRACRNLVNVPLANQTPCNPRDRSGYWTDLLFGRQQEKGDWQWGYSYIHIEREATVDAFNFSDLRVPTNVFNHRVVLNYQTYRNVQLGFTGLFGRPLVTTTTPTRESILKRLQFDVIYKF
ncbi:MAG: putative porin [Acidobacteria bacterium]|nr:putative porin [Acidobacteriota bacterium]